MADETAEEVILTQERAALDRWSAGDLVGYVQDGAPDLTYFDDIGAQALVDGLDAVKDYLKTLEGQIPVHRYEVEDPKVQLYGDVGVLTLRYNPFSLEGEPQTPWRSTTVRRRNGESWQMVHAHWGSKS
jgi:ketosteroid isomerase-like protein